MGLYCIVKKYVEKYISCHSTLVILAAISLDKIMGKISYFKFSTQKFLYNFNISNKIPVCEQWNAWNISI